MTITVLVNRDPWLLLPWLAGVLRWEEEGTAGPHWNGMPRVVRVG